MAAAFDTRLQGPVAFTGRASKGISHALRRQGYELVAEPESFVVTKENGSVRRRAGQGQGLGRGAYEEPLAGRLGANASHGYRRREPAAC